MWLKSGKAGHWPRSIAVEDRFWPRKQLTQNSVLLKDAASWCHNTIGEGNATLFWRKMNELSLKMNLNLLVFTFIMVFLSFPDRRRKKEIRCEVFCLCCSHNDWMERCSLLSWRQTSNFFFNQSRKILYPFITIWNSSLNMKRTFGFWEGGPPLCSWWTPCTC